MTKMTRDELVEALCIESGLPTGSALAGLSARAFLAVITPKATAGQNAGLADRIALAAQGGAKKWRAIAEAAEAEGDAESAELARDRSELREVEGDALIEGSSKGFSF